MTQIYFMLFKISNGTTPAPSQIISNVPLLLPHRRANLSLMYARPSTKKERSRQNIIKMVGEYRFMRVYVIQ
jgi:hypothetical protein